jgi:hypothetical protein
MTDNPYWDAVKDHIYESRLFGPGRQVQRWNLEGRRFDIEGYPDRSELTKRYSWTIPDPDSIEFVKRWSAGGLVDPMAGTGYWAYVLEQAGVDVVSYDLHPGDNPWHHSGALHTKVTAMNAVKSVRLHPNRTLLLAWPPYDETIGDRTVRAYGGDRVIYMGEIGGCTGTEALHDRLDRRWEEMDEHIPVQWEGLHDRITVYQRRSSAKNNRAVRARGRLSQVVGVSG